ncbi:MAG: prepilin-type N-terminal cleavage/methylation domain-containing protein [Nitrospirae bacterium]|nr:MAG: prepilin-type N-terminal cleavage/methylation domain-containing protein [Nitrospirota bacterium]
MVAEKRSDRVNNYNALRNAKGFTLIELSIVLIIIGIIMGLGIGVVGPLLKGAKIKQAQDYLEGAIQSVISFGMGNQRLPNTGEFPTGLRNPNDPWGNRFWYIYDNKTATTAEGGICGRKSTNLRLAIIDATTGTTTNIDNVAFIVFSGGANFNNQTAGPTGDAGTSAGVVTINTYLPLDNPNVQVDNYAGDVGGTRNEPYDDIVKWVTLSELRIKANCTGAQLSLINDSLPFGQIGSAYGPINVYPNGGVPNAGGYRWCIQNATGASAPSGITYSDNNSVSIPFSTNCQGLAEGSWSAWSTHVVIAGTPTGSSSSNSLTFFVRDNNDPTGTNDNIGQKMFILTIYPSVSAGSYAPAGSQVSFANNMANFSTPASVSTANSVSPDTTNNTLALGNNVLSSRGCIWYTSTGDRLDTKVMKAYFEFKNLKVDTGNSITYGHGFTFALKDTADTNVCGDTGAYLGYDTGTLTSGNLTGNTIAVEFDTYPNLTVAPTRADPDRAAAVNNNSYNHVAIVKNRRNNHDNVTNASCSVDATYTTSTDSACTFGNTYGILWFEDNTQLTHRVRVEVDHDVECTTGINGRTGDSRIRAWVDCVACNNISQTAASPTTTPTVKDCFNATGATNYIYGFTQGTGTGTITQDILISSFGISFYPYP